jgi:hypothetical protein
VKKINLNVLTAPYGLAITKPDPSCNTDPSICLQFGYPLVENRPKFRRKITVANTSS